MVIGVPSSPMNIQSVANFETPPRLDSWCELSLPLARTQCLHQFRNGKMRQLVLIHLQLHLAIRAHFQVLRDAFQRHPQSLARKPINTMTPPVSDFIFALVSALSRYAPPASSNSRRLPANSLSIVPPVLRNLCSQVSLGVI